MHRLERRNSEKAGGSSESMAHGVVVCRGVSGSGMIRAGRASHIMESRSSENEGGVVVVAGSRGPRSKGWLEGWLDSG